MENRARVIFYCARRRASFLVSDFIWSALLESNRLPKHISVDRMLFTGLQYKYIRRRSCPNLRDFYGTWVHYLGERFPCDMANRFSLWGCPVSAQHAQLDRCCVSQSMCKMFPLFRKRPTTIYSACEKKIGRKGTIVGTESFVEKRGIFGRKGVVEWWWDLNHKYSFFLSSKDESVAISCSQETLWPAVTPEGLPNWFRVALAFFFFLLSFYTTSNTFG